MGNTSCDPENGGWRAAVVRVARSWIDSGNYVYPDDDQSLDWLRMVPYIALHLAVLGVFWVGTSTTALLVAAILYVVRMFAITGFYHRYFAHKSFRTSRVVQFLFAVLAVSAVQRGPLWWSAHHRIHHAHSDKEGDPHSPARRGFLWAHTGWFLSRGNFATRTRLVRDWMRFPELRWLDRFELLVPVMLALGTFCAGQWLARTHPGLGTNGMQLFIWGFCVSTIALYHGTFTVNSLAHRVGTRRYETRDNSRNNWLIAFLTLGEGWHNNHHHYPGAARQGFFWWEIDATFYVLYIMRALGLIWDMRPVPRRVLSGGRNS
jgi:stearoyl-CoA desaturase (delta-9 desaturase)